MSGTWPGFSADWEESSEYQEAKASLRRERQAREALKLRAAAIVQRYTPTASRVVCPECGMPAEQSTRERAGVYYVDLVCPFCEWADLDREGGI